MIPICLNSHQCLQLILRKIFKQRGLIHQNEHVSYREVGVGNDIRRQFDVEAVSKVCRLISLNDPYEGLILVGDQVVPGIELFDLFDDCAKENIIIGLVVGRIADIVHHGSGLEHSLVDHHIGAYERIVGEYEQVCVGEHIEEGRLEVAGNGSGEVRVGVVGRAELVP